MVENPSADKFGPPPENAQRERVRQDGSSKAQKSIWPAVLMVTIFGLQFFWRSHRGWGSALAILLAVAGYGAEYIFYRQQQAAKGGPDPYTRPTHITR